MKRLLETLLEFLVSIVVSGILVGILQNYLSLDLFQGILFVILSSLTILALQINYRSSESLKLSEKFTAQENKILDDINKLVNVQTRLHDYEIKIQRISDGLKFIASKYNNESDFFAPWYDERISNLLNNINHTIETESYYFIEGQIQEQDRMWKIFKGQKTDYFWATCTCKGIEWFLTPEGDYVTKGLDDTFKHGGLIGIRRLFLYESDDELADFRTTLCFFLHKQSGYEYRVISRKDFDSMLHRFGSSTMASDFGIYGEHFVWETSTEHQVFIESGNVCVSKMKIAKYADLFNKIWAVAMPMEIKDEQITAKYQSLRMYDFRNLYNVNLKRV